MTITALIIFTGLIAYGLLLHIHLKVLRAERAKRRHAAQLSYEAITHFCDLIHRLGWSLPPLPESAKHQPLIHAADLIGKAAFRLAASSSDLSEDDYLFSTDVYQEDYGAQLATLELGEFNSQRDALVRSPTLIAALGLMGALMHAVMGGAEQQLHASAKAPMAF